MPSVSGLASTARHTPWAGRFRLAPVIGGLIGALMAAAPAQAQLAGGARGASLDQELRIVWGGSTARTYQGSLSISEGTLDLVRNLSMLDGAAGTLQQTNNATLTLLPYADSTFGGADLCVRGKETSQLTLQLRDPITDQTQQWQVTLAELQSGMWTENLDGKGNRVAIERLVHDRLRVQWNQPQSVRECGTTSALQVSGYRTGLAEGDYQLSAHWSQRRGGNPLATATVRIDSQGNFQPVHWEIKIPAREGGHRLELQLARANLLSNWSPSRPLLSRSVDVAAFDPAADPSVIANWKPLMAIDTVGAVKSGSLSWIATIANPVRAGAALEMPDLPRLSELGLSEQWNRLVPFSRSLSSLGNVTRVGQLAVREQSIPISGGAMQWQRYVEISPDSWLALPVTGLQAGHPHRLRMEVPVDQANYLSVSIRDPGQDELLTLSPQSSVMVREGDYPASEGSLTHDLVFWPRGESISILFASRGRGHSASVGKVLLESAELAPSAGQPAATHRQAAELAGGPRAPAGDRQVGVYIDQPFLVDCFAAGRDKDPHSGRSLETWETWHEVSRRAVHSLQLAKADTLILTAVTGGLSLIPMDTLQTLHALDRATFSSDGRSPELHDAVDLLLRHLDRAGLRLVIEIDLTSILPSLNVNPDNQAELCQVDIRGQLPPRPPGQAEIARPLNPLSREVQSALTSVVMEILNRYKDHPSLAGVSLRLNESSHFVFAGERWGYNAELLSRFAKETGVTLPADADQRSQLFQGSARLSFLTWRAQELSKFYDQLSQSVRRVSPEASLYLNTVRLWDRVPAERDFVDPEAALRNPQQLLLCYGLDVSGLARIDGLVVTQGSVRNAWRSLAGKDWLRASSAEQGIAGLGVAPQAALITHQPRVHQLPPPHKESSAGSLAGPRIYPDALRHGRYARQALVDQLWRSDQQLLAFGGWHPIWLQEPALTGLLETFQALPGSTLQDRNVLPREAPIRVRSGTVDGQTYLVLLNASGMEAEVAVQLNGLSATAQLRPVGGQVSGPVELAGGRVTCQLPAFDMLAWTSDQPFEVTTATYRFDDQDYARIAAQVDELERLVALAADPAWQRVLFRVGGTFEQWIDPNRPVGWSVSSLPQTSIQQATELPHSGSSSLSIENNNTGQVSAWIQSSSIELPDSGRLVLRAWLRTSAADYRQPLVRLGLVGRLRGGERYQRSILYGGADNEARPLANDWGRRPAELHVSDIPIDDLTELQVAIDLIGPGKVWVDDVEVVQTWLHPEERNYLRGQLLVVKQKLAENNPYPAEKLLGSAWNHYLSELRQSMSGQAVNTRASEQQPGDSAAWNRTKPALQQWREGWLERWRR